MQHRPEIDGLRAVAVLPVILFHAGFDIFGGGYVGVDVFFVISGYLITGILISDLTRDRFSIVRFYERRARRILPALCVVMLACLPFAYMWMLPSQLEDFAQSLVAVVFFASNVLFWREDDYFAAAAELKPLLHTWSLAVEEQYYLLFPLFLVVMWRLGRQPVFWTIVALAVTSLLLAEWGWRNVPSANFYLAPFRAWELFAGSICAFIGVRRPRRSGNACAAIGLALVVYAIFGFDAATPFPSLYALVPVVGTALIILFASERTIVARLLSTPAFVGIGLISYSAYLWHQPLFAFARLRSLTEPDHAVMALLSVATLLLAWATWSWIEQPFRRRANPVCVTRRSVFRWSSSAGVGFLALGLVGDMQDGFKNRLTETQREIVARGQPVHHVCENGLSCLIGASDGDFSGVAFVGDSHMGRYAALLNEGLLSRNLNARLVANGWCAPLLYWRASVAGRCGGGTGVQFESAFREVLTDDAVHTVVLAAQWANYTTGYRHGSRAISYDFQLDGERNTSVSANPQEFGSAVAKTVSDLRKAGKRVIFVGPVPEYGFDVPTVALRQSMFAGHLSDAFLQRRAVYDRRNADVFAALSLVASAVDFIDVWALSCGTDACSPFSEKGFPLYNDGNHLTRDGLKPIVDAIMRELI